MRVTKRLDKASHHHGRTVRVATRSHIVSGSPKEHYGRTSEQAKGQWSSHQDTRYTSEYLL